MQAYRDLTFQSLDTWQYPMSLQDMEFHSCKFDNCFSAKTEDPSNPFTIKRVHLHNCVIQACALHATVLDEILVDGLKRSGRDPLFLFGCLYRHVKVKGKVTAPKINSVTRGSPTSNERLAWKEAANRFYVNVDWAIDIEEARFNGLFDMPGIPSSLVRRDPETQPVLVRKRILQSGWRDLKGDVWGVCINWLLKSESDSVIVVVGKADRQFQTLMSRLSELRHEGVID